MPQGMLTGQDLPPVATLALLPAPSSCPGCRCFVVEAGYEVCSTGSAWVANGAGALLAQAKSYADTQDSGHASNRSAHGLGVSTAHVEAAKSALVECSNIDECMEWADKMAALASYAKQVDDDDLELHARRIRARAIRRCGELLKEIQPAHGANQNIADGSVSNVQSRTAAARQAGLSERQQVTAMRVANIPQRDFEEQIEAPTPPTITRLADSIERDINSKQISSQAASLSATSTVSGRSLSIQVAG